MFTSRSERKKINPPSRQRRSANRLTEFLEKKKQLATVNSDETSSSDDTGRQVEDSHVLATPGTSLTMELSGCQQIEFEVRDDSPGLRHTAPDGSRSGQSHL